MHVKAKSKLFAAFIKRISAKKEPTLLTHAYPEAFYNFPAGTKLWVPQEALFDRHPALYCLSPSLSQLITPEEKIGANLSFLLLDGLEDGIDVTGTLPVSVHDSMDFYYAAQQGLQTLYLEWIRPYTITSILKEVLT